MTSNKSKKRKLSLNEQTNPDKGLNHPKLKPNVRYGILDDEDPTVDINTKKAVKKISKLNMENKQNKKMQNEKPEINSKNSNKLNENQSAGKKTRQTQSTSVKKSDNNENKCNIGNNSEKKQKQMNNEGNHTITSRVSINGNWYAFLAKSMNVDMKIEKPSVATSNRGGKKKTKTAVEASKLEPCTINKEPQNEVPNSKIAGTVRTPILEKTKLTKFIAMDTEMVGIGFEGRDSMVARVSLVNKFGDCIYDKFVKPREPVVDYRTSVSGIRKEDLINGEQFEVVQKEVSEILRGKILVGHSVQNDLKVLYLSHPRKNIRDTTTYKPFKKITKSTPSLKRLTKEILGVDIQSGEHSSVEDAKAVMKLYCMVANSWEENLSGQRHKKKVYLDN